MNIKQLQYFIAVVREGSFSAAAKSLGISQPPLSSQIKLLEEELAVELLERGCRPVRPTQAGELLYLRACTLTDLASATIAELRGSSGGKETHELISQLKKGLIDLAVVRTPFREQDFRCAYLESEPMAAVGIPRFFPQGAGQALPLSALSQVPLIFYRRFEHLLFSAFQGNGITPWVFCKNDDARTTLLWASAGLGVALAPLSICRLMQREGTLLFPLDEPSLSTRIALICPKGRPLSPAGESFFSLFQEKIR